MIPIKSKSRSTKSKKGQFFMPLLVVITIFTFTGLLLVITEKNNTFISKLGDKQFSIEQSELAAERAQLYIDLSAEHAFKKAFKKTLASAGRTPITPATSISQEQTASSLENCGTYRGAAIVFSSQKACTLTTSSDRVIAALNSNFNAYMNEYLRVYSDPTYPEMSIPLNNYLIQVKGKKVYGHAQRDLFIPIYGKTNSLYQEILNDDYFKDSRECKPLEMQEYSEDDLKRVYGETAEEIERSLTTISFMNKEIEIHDKVINIFSCVEAEIKKCDAALQYEFKEFITTGNKQGQQEVLGVYNVAHDLGIALDINPKSNELVTDIPGCVVDAFKKYGFAWGGDDNKFINPKHLAFLGNPEDATYMVVEQQISDQVIISREVPELSTAWKKVLDRIYTSYSTPIRRYGSQTTPIVPASLMAGVIAQESRGNPNAVSPSGCKGLMQFCSAAAQDYNLKDRFDAEDSIRAGAQYLSRLIRRYDQYTDKYAFALASYNGGHGVVEDAIASAKMETGDQDPQWEEVSEHITVDLIRKHYKQKYFKPEKRKMQKVREIQQYIPGVHAKEAYYAKQYEQKESVLG